MRYVIERFRELHQSGCFVIPNPWDPGSAAYLHKLGFKALATTSSGFAFSRGMPDDIRYVQRDTVLKHFAEIVNATPLPVNGDFQNGHADEPEGVAESVALFSGSLGGWSARRFGMGRLWMTERPAWPVRRGAGPR